MRPVRAFGALCALVVCLRPAAALATTITVPAGGDLQAAIDAAQPGDTVLLEAGATFSGNFVLRAKSGTDWITIRSSANDNVFPGAGGRMSPASAPNLPKIQSPNSSPAIATEPYAHYYRLQFLELGPNSFGYGDIVQLGDGSPAQNSAAMVPHDLIVDRVYAHGNPTYGQKRCISLNSASTTVTGSYIADCKAVSQDSQAIAGWNGPGPFTITNNYLEAAGENLLFGGADPAIPNLVPSDIRIAGNHFSKPIAWRSQSWQVKNLLELKNAQRVTIDGNLLENNWENAQAGYAIVFTPRNQDGTAAWTVVQQVQFTNNVVRHVASAINILGTDNENASRLTNAIAIRNNLLIDVSSSWGGSGRFLLLNGGASITVDHNTIVNDGSSTVYADSNATNGFVFTNNVLPDNAYGIMGSNASPGNDTIGAYFPGGVFEGNVIAGGDKSQYPQANYYPPSLASVGFVDSAGGDYRLATNSPYRAAATDGSDVGCSGPALATAQDAGADASSAGTSAGTPGDVGATSSVADPPQSTNEIVWQRNDGALAVWLLNGTSMMSASIVSPAGAIDPSWKVVETADFDGNGSSDLLWRNETTGDLAVWLMDGTVLESVLPLQPGGVSNTAWQIAGVADFNRDGHPDLLWWNEQTGELAVWLLEGVQLRSIALLTPAAVADTSWRVAGVGDFDGDGKPDILWKNASTGMLGLWLMNGTALKSTAMLSPAQVGDADWQLAAVGDFNGDGRPDLVWRYAPTGLTGVWLMNGARLQSVTMMNAADPGWRMAAAK